MELKGKIKVIKEVQQVTDTFKKREFVLTTDEQYPQDILIELVQDKTSLLDNMAVGQEITVGINIQGKEWTNPQGEVKYFNSIKAWKIEATPLSQNTPPSTSPKAKTHHEEPIGDPNDDLPF